MKYTVYEYVITGERYFTKYKAHDELNHVLSIKHVDTIEEAQELCKVDDLLISNDISDEELKDILESKEYIEEMKYVVGVLGY